MYWLLLQPDLLGPFFIIIGAIVLIGLAQTLTAQQGSETTGGFWTTLKAQLSLSTYFGFVAKFTRYVVSRFAGAHLRTLAHWLRALGTIALGVFVTPVDNAIAIEEALRSLFIHGDPKARRAAKRAQTTATHGLHVATHAQQAANADAQHLRRYRAVTTPRVNHAVHAVDVTLPRDIAGLRARNKALEDAQTKDEGAIRSLEDGAVKTFEWIRAHPLSSVTAVFTGAVAIALARLGFGFLRCRNWQNLGKRLTCGMGKWLLDALEAIATFALAYFAVLKPEVLAQEAVAAVDGIESILTQILDN
jgi:hypothetical protein